MTDRDIMKQALEALKLIDEAMPFPVAKLTIKNLIERLAQPEQKPLAWISAVMGDVTTQDMSHTVSWVPLYTTPPQRKPLSQYAIDRIIGRLQVEFPDWLDTDVMTQFARAIEAAHGIKENS